MSTTTTASGRTIDEVTEAAGMTWRHWVSFALIALIMLTDGMDVTIVSHTFPSLVKEWGVSIGGGITFVVTAGFISMGLGALIAGRLSDLLGRKAVLVATTTLFASATALGATSPDFMAFTAWRLLACLGMGAAMATSSTLVADLVPPRRRAALLATAYAAVALGTTLGAALAGLLLPLGGWRALLVAGGIIPLAIVLALAAVVPESPAFCAARGDLVRARRALARLIPTTLTESVTFSIPKAADRTHVVRQLISRRFRITTALLWVFGFLSLGTQLMIVQYLPTLLQQPTPGLDSVQSSTVVGLYGLTSVAGTLVIGAVLTKVSRFVAIGSALILSAAAAVLVGVTPDLGYGQLLLLLGIAGFVLPAAFGPTRSVLAAAAYPTRIRGTGVGSTEFSARIGSAVGGAVGGTLIGAGLGLTGLFLTLLAPIAVLTATVFGLAMDARRRGDASSADSTTTAGSRGVESADTVDADRPQPTAGK
ncbi:MFS transporter [Microbacterium foliorum]|uniref:MFS transporter n=1 Tax=Microbacterium foliorum TaxID=104336 RepID=UPI003735BC04